MNFLKPTKLTIAIFSLLFLLLVSPLIGEFIGSYELPTFLAAPLTLFNLISIAPLFTIFKNLGVNVGHTTDYFGFPVPNLFGWILIIFINGAIYYLVASSISYIIKSDRKQNVVFCIVSLVAIIYIGLLLFYSITSAKKNEPIIRCTNECLTPAEEIYNSCTSQCWSFFPPDKFREEYNSCMNDCDIKRNDFVKQCNAKCLSK